MIGHAPLPPPRWKVRYVFTHGFRPRSFEFSRPRNHGVSKNACPPSPPRSFSRDRRRERERERDRDSHGNAANWTSASASFSINLFCLERTSSLLHSLPRYTPSTRFPDYLSLSLFRALVFLNSFNSRIPCIELGSSSLVIIHRSFPLLSREHAAISNRPRVSDCPFARQMVRRKEEEKEEEKSVGEMPSIHPSIHPPRR